MKRLKFFQKLVPLMLSGEKTTTWRLWDDKDLQIGDQVECLVSETMEPFGSFVITEVIEKPLKNLEESDFAGHEKYDDLEKLYKDYTNYYQRQVNGDTMLKVVRFKFSPY